MTTAVVPVLLELDCSTLVGPVAKVTREMRQLEVTFSRRPGQVDSGE